MGAVTGYMHRWRKVAAALAIALALLWPAFVNGEPFYMPDTPSYLRGADGAIHEVTGATSLWSAELQKRFQSAEASQRAAVSDIPNSSAPGNGGAAPAQAEPEVVLKGRSIYYGAFLWAAQWLGNFWAMALFQALLCAVAMMLTLTQVRKAYGRKTEPGTLVGAGLAMAVLTPVGFFASYLLPDVLGGLAILAVGHLCFFWNSSGRGARIFWFLLLAFAVVSHAANIMLVGALAVIAALAMCLRAPTSKPGLAVVAGALVIAVCSQLLFAWGVTHATGRPPVRPPFLAARIIEDGPGYEYLRKHCPEVRLIYCRTLAFPQRQSDTLLWSANPSEGIFQALEPAEERRAAAEQNRFVFAVVKERPLDILGSSVRAFFGQLGYFSLESFNYTRANIYYFERKIPPPFIDHAKGSRAYQDRMPVAFTEWATILTVIASLVAIAWALAASLRRERRLTRATSFILLLLAGVLVNAAICGALSTPRGRYQMRLIWVLPLAALATSRIRVGEGAATTVGDTQTRAAAAE